MSFKRSDPPNRVGWEPMTPAKKARMSFSRRSEVLRVMKKLERESYPRLQMVFLVVVTGAAGLGSSFLLLQLGMEAMHWRSCSRH